MFLEIVTPDSSIFRGDVETVTVPGVDGEFQMLNNHAPIVSLLREGKVKFSGDISIEEAFQNKFTEGNKNSFELLINSGTIELKENKIIILVD